MSMMVSPHRFVSAPTTDPYFASTVLLLGYEWANTNPSSSGNSQASDVDDESAANNTAATVQITSGQPARTTTTDPKFGSKCWEQAGSNVGIRYNDDADWDFGSAPFTIETWVKFSGAGVTNADIIAQWGSFGASAWWFRLSGGNLQFYIRENTTGNEYTMLTSAWAPAQDVWYNIAVDRDGSGHWRSYLNGTMANKNTTARTINNGTAQLRIGQRDGGGTLYDLQGYLDETRITKGVARYASDGGFTLQTAAFPRS